MKVIGKYSIALLIAWRALFATCCAGTVHYVSLDGGHVAPFTNWVDAANTIQAAVAAATSGDTVLVTNGTYHLPIPYDPNLYPSTIVVDKDIRIESVNGRDVTIVDGNNTVRCFNLGSNACVVSGFTIQNGVIDNYPSPHSYGGGIYCDTTDPIITNCVVRNCEVGSVYWGRGGGIYRGTSIDCVVSNNNCGAEGAGINGGTAISCDIVENYALSVAGKGGGIADGTASNCVIRGNQAWRYGGVYASTVYDSLICDNECEGDGGGLGYSSAYNCIISNNYALTSVGAGLYHCLASNCIVVANNAHNGGGLYNSTAVACVIKANSGYYGSGMYGGVAVNSLIVGNVADDSGGIHYTVTTNCTLTDNYLEGSGYLDASDSVLLNSIISNNDTSLAGGTNQLINCYTNNPLFVDAANGDYRLAYHSPCIDAGSNAFITTAFDLAGNPRIVNGTVDIGAYESLAVIHVSLDGNDANDGFSWTTAKATIQGGVDAQYDTGVVLVSNGTYVLTSEITVDKDIHLESLKGRDATIVDGNKSVRCFNLSLSKCVVSGFTIRNGYALGKWDPYVHFSWAGGGVYCYYNTSAMVTNCVLTRNVASKEGGGMYGGTIIDSLISSNEAGTNDSRGRWPYSWDGSGGGLYLTKAVNCVISNNIADCIGWLSIAEGGGMCYGEARNCLFYANSCNAVGGIDYDDTYRGASGYGGGVIESEIYNCTVVGNYVIADGNAEGGGQNRSTVYNSIIWSNFVEGELSNNRLGNINNSCSPDLNPGVKGNVTNAPMFVDAVNGDFRLLSNSPCINWGNNAYVSSSIDLDGSNRVVEGYVDMGCYEYQGILGLTDSDGDGLPDDWERQYFGGNADPNRDDDNDGHWNWQERITGMHPLQGTSIFAITNAEPSAGFIIEWPCVAGRYYSIFCTTDLTDGFHLLESNLIYPQNSYTDVVHNASAQVFYEVRVSMEPYVAGVPAGMVMIPAGTNVVADPDFIGYALTNATAFYMDVCEVSSNKWVEVAEWAATNGYTFVNNGSAAAADHPIVWVNWYDCAKWCNARSEMEGRTPCYSVSGSTYTTGQPAVVTTDFNANGFRMPTHEEWEYAARGGVGDQLYPWGNSISSADARYDAASTVACGSYTTNSFGLYDMAGNVWEWCDDITMPGKRARASGGYSSSESSLRCGVHRDIPNEGLTDNAWLSVGFRTVLRQ